MPVRLAGSAVRTRVAVVLTVAALALLAPRPARAHAHWRPDWRALWGFLLNHWQDHGHGHGHGNHHDFKLTGTVSWGKLSAGYARVSAFDLDEGVFYDVDTLGRDMQLKKHGTEAKYTLDVTDGTNLIVFVTAMTCADGQPSCGHDVLGSIVNYSSNVLNVPRGKLDLDLHIGENANPLYRVCGQVTAPGEKILRGETEFDSTNTTDAGTTSWITRLALGRNNTYCADVMRGTTTQLVSVLLKGCSLAVGDEGFYPLGFLDGPRAHQDIAVEASTAAPGSIAGSFSGIDALFPPDDPNVGTFSSGSRAFVSDCQGGAQFAVGNTNPFTLTRPGTDDARLTPGEWDLQGSAGAFAGVFYGYLFPAQHVSVAPNATTQVEFSLGPAAVYDGAADLTGWALGAADLAEITGDIGTDLGIASSRASTTDFPVSDLPAKIILDSRAGSSSSLSLTASASYDFGDGTTCFLAMGTSQAFDPPFAAGTHALPGMAAFDVTVGDWTVEGGDASFGIWSGGVAPDFSSNATAFGGEAGFHAKLVPGFYEGAIDSAGLDLDVEMGAGDVEHRNVSGPVVRDIEPEPGAISGPTVTVSARVTDLDGVAAVTIGGQPVPVGPDGAVSATVAATSQVSIVATDALGNQTTHTRTFEVTP